MTQLKRVSLMSVAVCAMASSAAVAQGDNYYSRDKYEAVRDRAQPEFDPEPVRLGAFLLRPVAELGLTATNNVFATDTNKESDVIGRIGAQVAGDTIWSVHSFGFDVSAYRNEYFDQSKESNDELRARLRGRLDVTRELSFGGSVFVEDLSEPRTDFVSGFSSDAPIEYTRHGATVEANYQSDRFRWNNAAGITKEDFDNGRQVGTGLPIDQSYRDRTITDARTRLSYAVSPNLAVYGQGTVSKSDYDSRQIIDGIARSRDSTGYTISGGVDFELNALVRGDVAVGYLKEEKDDSFFRDVSGLSIDGRMQWFPTRLTTVGFELGRRAIDVGAFDAPTAIMTRGGVRVDHELRRNIIVSGYANLAKLEYEETDREDDNFEVGALATYKMNRRVHWDVFVRHLDRDVSGTAVFGDPSYGVTQAGIGLRLHP